MFHHKISGFEDTAC